MQTARLTRRRRLAIFIGVAVCGLALILVAVFSGTDDASGNSGSDVPPLGTQVVDPTPTPTGDLAGRGRSLDEKIGDPFAASYGAVGLRRVSVRLRSDGLMNVRVKFRDGKSEVKRVANRTFEITRTIESQFPVVGGAVQVGTGTTATCEVSIDGAVVVSRTVSGKWHVAACVA